MKTLIALVLIMFCLTSAFAQRDRMGGHEGGGRIAARAVYVIFNSVGNGIDGTSETLVSNLIGKAFLEGQTLDNQIHNWGREGEVTYCVQFVDANKRYNFVKDIALSIKNDRARLGFTRTSVKVGFDCSNEEIATEQDLERY